jgi:hypothetical protein
MTNYVNLINTWRRNWKTQTKYLAIVGCDSTNEAIKVAVKKAHSPSVARALKTEGVSTSTARNEVANYLEPKIADVLKRDSFTFEEYDEWASDVCTSIRGIYRDHGITDYTFGNAQKLLNMAIKYVLSADNIDPTLPIFKVAHIPVDRVIMKIAKNKLNVRPMETAWSQTDDLGEIISYQRRFRAAIPANYSPVTWECENWSN